MKMNNPVMQYYNDEEQDRSTSSTESKNDEHTFSTNALSEQGVF